MPEETTDQEVQDQVIDTFYFKSDEDVETPPAQRQLQKNVISNVVTSFRDIGMLRKHYINEAKNSLLEVRRAKKDIEKSIEQAQKWEDELNDAIDTIPEFSEETYEEFDYSSLLEKADLPADEIKVEGEDELGEDQAKIAQN